MCNSFHVMSPSTNKVGKAQSLISAIIRPQWEQNDINTVCPCVLTRIVKIHDIIYFLLKKTENHYKKTLSLSKSMMGKRSGWDFFHESLSSISAIHASPMSHCSNPIIKLCMSSIIAMIPKAWHLCVVTSSCPTHHLPLPPDAPVTIT